MRIDTHISFTSPVLKGACQYIYSGISLHGEFNKPGHLCTVQPASDWTGDAESAEAAILLHAISRNDFLTHICSVWLLEYFIQQFLPFLVTHAQEQYPIHTEVQLMQVRASIK